MTLYEIYYKLGKKFPFKVIDNFGLVLTIIKYEIHEDVYKQQFEEVFS